MKCLHCGSQVDGVPGSDLPASCPACHGAWDAPGLGRYAIESAIWRGARSEVWRARHRELGTPVAIKVVHAAGGADALRLDERFVREARAAARIDHPGIVRVHDFDRGHGRLFLVMELASGVTLREALADAPFAVGRATALAAQLCDVLAAAHRAGIAHRDVKPENLVVDAAGRLRVLDFGIAHWAGEDERLTRTGEILGTPEYLAPEQVLEPDEEVDGRADLFAAGVVLYEMLTGVSPFAGPNLLQVLRNVEALDPPSPSTLRAGIPPELDDLVLRALQKDPGKRPASAEEMAERLRALPIAPHEPAARTRVRRRRAITRLATLVSGLVLGATVAWFAAGPAVEPPQPPAGPALRLAAALDPSALEDRAALLERLTAEISDTAPAEQRRVEALAQRHLGALADSFATLGTSAPRDDPERAIARHYAHTLFACLVENAPFLTIPIAPDEPGPEALLAHAEHPADRAALTALGHVLRGDVDLARQAAREGLAAAPWFVPLQIVAARCAPAAERPAALLEVAERLDRRLPERHELTALALVQAGETERAWAHFELATGAGCPSDFAVVFAAARCVAATPLAAREQAALADLLATASPAWPGATATRTLLALSAGDAAGTQAALRALAEHGRGLAELLAWARTAPPGDRERLCAAAVAAAEALLADAAPSPAIERPLHFAQQLGAAVDPVEWLRERSAGGDGR